VREPDERAGVGEQVEPLVEARHVARDVTRAVVPDQLVERPGVVVGRVGLVDRPRDVRSPQPLAGFQVEVDAPTTTPGRSTS
jgi:hypothetical protein